MLKKVGFNMIKKFLQEFKSFALKGNVMDLAIGVIIGASFQDIVTSLTENFINPLINCIGGAEVAGKIKLGNTGQALDYGAFLTSVINFIIMAFVLFLLMKGINTIMHIGKKKEEEVKKEEPSQEEVLLTEIRDLLKVQNVVINPDSEKTE